MGATNTKGNHDTGETGKRDAHLGQRVENILIHMAKTDIPASGIRVPDIL